MHCAFSQLIFLCALFLAAADLGAQPVPSRPNILFIFSDDHAYQAVSADGFGLNRTPNIDRLGTEGMRFDRCLTTYSLCGPSRACVITGKYSHLNGFYNNYNSRFDGSQVTLPKLLREAGYQTAIVGKWHLVSDPTGFDYWEVLPGQGQYYNPRMTLNGQPVRKQGYVTDIITEDSLDWLKNQRDRSKPFLLMCQHKAPHREWEPALSKLAMYDGTTFPEPPTLFDDYSGRGKAEHEQQMEIGKVMNDRDLKLVPPPTLNGEQRKTWDAHYDPIIADFKSKQLAGQDLVRWKYQRYMHDYLATISSVDDSVGKMLDYLKESGLEQNTIVVYASDQGFYLGEHGWFDKRWIFEESMRTPLLIRWPGVIKPGRVNNDIVSNLDFAETFLDAAGVPIPADMQGHSMVPLLKGQTPADWRKSFYYHYYEHPAVHNVARHYGVVTDRYKLVYFYEPEMNYWEMFDLKTDPHEMKSIYGQPDYAQVQADLHKELDRLRKELKLPDTDPPASIIPKQPAGGAMALNAWVLEYRFDKERGDTVIDASGHNNDGTAHNSPLVDGRDGHKARRFTGDGDIAVRKSPSLNPAVGAWTVEATFKSDRPDGIILAHGGTSFGYCLAIEQGKPVFTIVSNRQPERVSAGEVITGKWTTVVARFDQEHLLLEVDGKPAGRIALEHPLSRNPAESLQIGADLGTTVLATPLPRFSGLIESVRIYSGLEP